MARGADGSLLTKDELEKLNLERYNQAIATGNLYNTGPIVDEGGTSFSPERWDEYFNKNESLKPTDYVPQKELQAQLDAGEEIDTSSQEFVVDKNEIDIRDEQDMTPSYPARGRDNSFLTADQAKAEVKQEEPVVEPKTSEFADEIKADIAMEAEIEKDFEGEDEFDSPVDTWIAEFESMTDEDFEANGVAIDQLPANAQEAYTTVAENKATAESDKTFDEEIAAMGEAIKVAEAEELAMSDGSAEYDARIKEIDDLYSGDMEKRGMLTTNVTDLGKGSGEAEADMLLRAQAGDMEISDMKETDREITTTIMKDTGLDMNQANELMAKLKGLCG